MSQYYDHEPSEGYAGVHVAKESVSFPQLYMEETVAEPVSDIQHHYLWVDQRKKEFLPVFTRQLQNDLDCSYDAP